jgi:hypothetical protein
VAAATATQAPTPPTPYVEGWGTTPVSWGTPFTVIDQAVSIINSTALASLAHPRAAAGCGAGSAITLTGQRRLGRIDGPIPATDAARTAATGATQVVATSDGGAVITRVDPSATSDGAPANLAYVSPQGATTPLTDYQGPAATSRRAHLAVTDLRPVFSGRIDITLQVTLTTRQGTAVRSTELIIDPRSRTISAVATGSGRLLFDEDDAGNGLVGLARPGAVDWRHQDGSPITAPGCEPAGPT